MKNLIKLSPVEGEISEVRGIPDLCELLAKGSPTERLALLNRLNLDDIETIEELQRLLELLTTAPIWKQFTERLDANFLKRVLALETNRSAINDSLLSKLINENNIACFTPLIESYNSTQILGVLKSLTTDVQKLFVNTFSELLTTKLKKSLSSDKKPNEPLSFIRWFNDFEAWDAGDTHEDRCSRIIDTISDALSTWQLVDVFLGSSYADTLFNSLNSIINNPVDLNRLLTGLSEKHRYLLMKLMVERGITAQQIELLSNRPDSCDSILVALFIGRYHSSINSTLIKAVIAVNSHSPEASLAHGLMSDTFLFHDLLLYFKEYSFQSQDNKYIYEYLISVMYALKNGWTIPCIPSYIAPMRKEALARFVEHLTTNEDYKVKIQALSEHQFLMLKHEVFPPQQVKYKFFDENAMKKQRNRIENSCFSDEQVSEILNQITTLQKEIKRARPFTHKDRKVEKVKGLKALLIKSTQMEPGVAIEQIEKEYPRIREGAISARTATLLDKLKPIRGYGQKYKTV
jgi:uncharacterized small protein (DUF1192 family)